MQIASRTHTILLVLVLAVGVAIVAMLATGVRGGPLDPPGSPASTDGVRQSGTPISSLPFTISQPGSYYVTRDLNGVLNQHGVTISASNVTLDLNGFTLHGVNQTGDGVLITGSPSNITIKNGSVTGWYNGIDAQLGSYVTISGISVIDNGGSSNDGSYGVILRKHSVLEDCNVSDGETTGVLATDSTVRNCIIASNGNDGLFVANRVLVQNVQVRDNNVHNDPGTAWVDVRWIGSNAITDSSLGSVTYDATSAPVAGAFARNCSRSPGTIGSFDNDVGTIDNVAGC